MTKQLDNQEDENLLNFVGHLGLQKNNPCTVCEFKKGHLSWRCGACEDYIKYIESLLEAQARVTEARVRKEERERAAEYLHKLCWSQMDIDAFLSWQAQGLVSGKPTSLEVLLDALSKEPALTIDYKKLIL